MTETEFINDFSVLVTVQPVVPRGLEKTANPECLLTPQTAPKLHKGIIQ